MKKSKSRTTKTAIPWRKSLSFRLTVTLILTSLLTGAVMMFFVNDIYQRRIDNEYNRKATALSIIAANMLDGETVDRYLETLEKDEEYNRILEQLRVIQREFDVAFIVISRITEEREIFVFDTDEDVYGHMGLGEYVQINEIVIDLLPTIFSGAWIEPFINEAYWGNLMIAGEPILREDGSVAAYAFVSVFMDDILNERRNALALLGLLIALLVLVSIIINLLLIRKGVIKPMLSEAERREEELARETEFYRKMSHNLRTPLTVVSTSIQVAKSHPEDLDRLLSQSQDEIMKMAKMINDALDDSEEVSHK